MGDTARTASARSGMRHGCTALLCVWALVVAPRFAYAEQNAPPPVVEVWGAASGVITGPSVAVTTSYSPPLLFGSDFTSRGGQTLAANAQSTLGLSGGVNIFPVSRLGLQVLVERASYDLSGANTPYLIALQYISRPPPSGEAQQTTLNQSNAWPDTSGSLTEWAVAFNAATRVGHPDRVGLILSAGPTFYRLSGEVQPLGFTTFRLGGHSVLFQDDYRLAASFEPSTGLGFDAGIELTAALGPHAAFVTGYRYFGGPALDARVQPTDILNTHELIQPESISSIVARLGPPAARVSMDSSRLFVGIKFRR